VKRPRQPVDAARRVATDFSPAADDFFDATGIGWTLVFREQGFPRKTEPSIPIEWKIVPAGAEIVFVIR